MGVGSDGFGIPPCLFNAFKVASTGAAAENMLGSLLCLPGSGSVLLDPCTGSTISETTSEAWSVEVLPSDSGQNASLKGPLVCRVGKECSPLAAAADRTSEGSLTVTSRLIP